MNGNISFFILFSFATSVVALEKDTLAKKERINFYMGLGINTNLIKTNNFHYHHEAVGIDDITEDYNIFVEKTYSPFLEISLSKKILKKRKFNICTEIKDMFWIAQEKFKVKGTESLDPTAPESVEKNAINQYVSNYLGASSSLLFNIGQSKIGFYIGAGLNYQIYYNSKVEIINHTKNYKYTDINEGYNEDFKFTLDPGFEIQYKIRNLNLKSQLFTLLQIPRNNIYSFWDFNVNNHNYLLFFSTSIKI